MDLRSDHVFWPAKNGLLQTYPSLDKNLTCDVVVLGGGITGALVAEALTRRNIATAVVDKGRIAHGSTSASTALIQYDVDEPLYLLQKKMGRQNALTVYSLCAEAIGYLEDLVQSIGNDYDFRMCPSVYFSTKKRDRISLKKEYTARKDAGFAVEFLEEDATVKTYGFHSRSAIRSALAAQVDPYRFTYSLLKQVQQRGGAVFEMTEVSKLETQGGVTLTTKEGWTITARKMVFAVGYEAKHYLKEKTADLRSTYACITKPLPQDLLWHEQCLLWNTDDPYFYARTTADNRIMFGGQDIDYEDDTIRDSLIPQKREALQKAFHDLFPHIPVEIEFTWAGTFGETKDTLPYIGESPEWENAYFALGYGGNGITFSAIAAQALADLYCGKKRPELELFRFGR
jgi:glycine/D-amino acid oxidase-like deaminating enzyme